MEIQARAHAAKEGRVGGPFWRFLCLACDRREKLAFPHNEDPYSLPERQQPCPRCTRPMHFRGYVDRPVPCSYQCAYGDKLAKQRARRKVGPHTMVCESCGEAFTSKRSDARCCSNACRQRLFRRNT